MERDTLIRTIRGTLTAVLGHDNFDMRDELTASDVEGWDSLTHMSIITGLESAFSIRFSLRDINKLKNMGSLIALIESKLPQQ
jgi:acyl carrier protein